MRYFMDTKFIEDGETIDLLSIGIVAEDGRTFYAETGADTTGANDWVKANVLPHLRGEGWQFSRATLAQAIRTFIGDDTPVFWSWCSAYDWVAVCQLYGPMIDKPEGWPSYCRDLQQELDAHGIRDDELPAQRGTSHDAASDAQWHADIYGFLVDRGLVER